MEEEDGGGSRLELAGTCQQICVVGSLALDPLVMSAVQALGLPVSLSATGSELIDLVENTIFIVDDMEGPLFEAPHNPRFRVLGRTALLELTDRGENLPSTTRPLFSTSMSGLVVCFTGFRKKDHLMKLVKLVQSMGGSIRKEMSVSVTHLIAQGCGGKKYHYATTFRVPVMSEDWVFAAWQRRKEVGFGAAASDFTANFKLKPFQGAKVCFVGFPEEEKKHMEEVLVENGGTVADMSDCSHVVVDNVQAQASTFGLMSSHIVKPEWFWISVQNEGAADETEYKFEGCLEGVMSPATSRDSLGTPTSSRLRKRKRIRDGVSRQIPDSPSIHKRRSSISDAGLLSLSSSFLDCSTVSEKLSTDEVEAATLKSLSNLSPRQQVFHELVQTETNYVGILRTIMTLIKKPLEEFSEGEGPLLDNTELKTIFGHLPPIYDLHAAMLQELIRANANWTETTSIGSIILRHSRDMVKAYPPFVNFFEQTKEMLHKCDETKPRFHAFLKVCQSKPECGRQTLGELLIRPVQRLPSISLLLGDILKHTRKDNPDHAALDEALHAVREVMTHINEDKRRMEACMDMFSIFNDIENCPPHLVSSHRAFVTRCDVIELSNELSGRGDALVFFLFSDILEICKKRSKGTSLKSPNTATLRSCKHFKHVRLIPLSDIKRVFDVEREGNNEENIFALKCRSNQELKEKLYSFSLSDEDIDKNNFLQTLCRQLANTVCKADAAYFLSPIDYNELDISANDAAFGTLSKAFKLASRTKMKIGRTFSFNSKTPSKLKRAVSSMMSPFGSTTNLTPASQLAQMRLASCTNLNELASSPSEPEALKPPMSVQPRRKRPV
ncbi:protein ECT2 isoform X2 [Frankliniella occidentalis]|uniref:Protein ECT2 isoform X2 n=1 Tax=Frankliniella occidentalis TaxID=133901 RepID=A0A6J1SW57_FRAOC|nr:protein ECT2 isoform X2 [Frankliniella occidentalis]